MKLTVCVFVPLLSVVNCSSILGIFPVGVKSHFVIFEALMDELARRGHDVVVISSFPKTKPLQNYTDIDVHSFTEIKVSNSSIDGHKGNFFTLAKHFLYDTELTGKVLTSPAIKKLLARSPTFDVVFIEMFGSSLSLLFANHFNAPVIGYSSSITLSWNLSPFAAPQNPSYIPSFTSGYSKNMTFSKRLFNTLLIVAETIYQKYLLGPKSTGVFEKYLGKSDISLEDAARNLSLILINTHFSYHSARPYPPQVVEVGGLHLKPAKALSQELDQWMNESTEGVIYFSFGSILCGASMPQDKVKTFFQVFEALPQRVLWKWEDDVVEKLPPNVKVMKWLPQRDVLAHPKVKVFISHGGLLGTTEAVVSGVPILGIPMYGDQLNNVAALVENGLAVHLDYNNISVTSLSFALNALIKDRRYADKAKLLSKRFLDRPQSPLETAVYWTEYVIRHHGALHLQSAAVHLAWYQYFLLDVTAVYIIALLAALTIIYNIIRFCIQLLTSTGSTKLKTN